MLFDRREKKKPENRRNRYRRTLGERIHKFIFFAGLAIAFKGLKGWIRSKRRKITR